MNLVVTYAYRNSPVASFPTTFQSKIINFGSTKAFEFNTNMTSNLYTYISIYSSGRGSHHHIHLVAFKNIIHFMLQCGSLLCFPPLFILMPYLALPSHSHMGLAFIYLNASDGFPLL